MRAIRARKLAKKWSKGPTLLRRDHAMQIHPDELFKKLHEAGLPPIPEEFSVVPGHQAIARETLTGIDRFIRTFDDVTTRSTWQEAVTAAGPAVTRCMRAEACFFSAWDFHLPADQPQEWKLIEFNDNGSGFLFASLINNVFHRQAGLEQDATLERPAPYDTLCAHVLEMVEAEATAFFGKCPDGLFLILDDARSLQSGKFRQEHRLLRALFGKRGWRAEVGIPQELDWDGRRLRWQEQDVRFIVNRSTDFLWSGDMFRTLQAAYLKGSVYVAPNPFTYSTRSDKRLLEFLSLPGWDKEFGICDDERMVLSAHVPETHLVRENNLAEIVRRKEEFVFKPAHGYAGRGLLKSSQVGHARLRQLLKKQHWYVAQKKVPKRALAVPGRSEAPLWTDLRVWAYRGQRYLMSGRASRDPDVLDLTPPGGWVPTYARNQNRLDPNEMR